MFKRTLYLGYYLKKLNKPLFKKFLDHVSEKKSISKISLLKDVLFSVYKYNISLLEYFQFHFYDKTHEERSHWAGTGTMYEFQLKANPPKERHILDDKRLFFQQYREFIRHQVYSLEELEKDQSILIGLLKNHEKLVFKDATGKCGSGVAIKSTKGMTPKNTLAFMNKEQFDMVETFIQQHHAINELSPSAVNTVRIFTKIDEVGNYTVLGCRMRISVNCEVDNLAAGNMAAPIDEATGIINGPGIYSDITKKPEKIHPVTGVPIVGFQIPFWKEILELVKNASLKHPQNKSIGWDVVVTEKGPGLIEGNHDWCKLVWQLPVNKGLKEKLYT